MEKGLIITISGISGAGKSHLIKNILSQLENFEKLKAITTRAKRAEEVEGVDYFFLKREEFELLQVDNKLSVINDVFGNMYAFYNSDLKKITNGVNLITELYYTEVKKFKAQFPSTLSIYILPENIAKAVEKLKTRRINSEELQRRLKDIEKEIGHINMYAEDFDFIVSNNYTIESFTNLYTQIETKIDSLNEKIQH